MTALPRRVFVQKTLGMALACPLGVALTGALAGCASLVTRTVTPVDGKLRLALTHYPELTEPGGSLKVVAEGATDSLYILSVGDNRYVALSPICTHLGCTVEIQDARLVCPCHGSTYDREGQVLQGPAQRALHRYNVSLTTDGVLVIDLDQRT